jgi:hypothetical protein
MKNIIVIINKDIINATNEMNIYEARSCSLYVISFGY